MPPHTGSQTPSNVSPKRLHLDVSFTIRMNRFNNLNCWFVLFHFQLADSHSEWKFISGQTLFAAQKLEKTLSQYFLHCYEATSDSFENLIKDKEFLHRLSYVQVPTSMHTHAHTHKCTHILLVKNSCSKQFCTVTHIPTVWSHLVCIHMSLCMSKQIKYSPKNPCRCHSWKALKCRFELRNEARCEWARQQSLEVRAWASGHVPVYLLCHFGWVTLAQFSQVWKGDKTVALHKIDTAQHLKQSWWALKKLTIIIYALIHSNYMNPLLLGYSVHFYFPKPYDSETQIREKRKGTENSIQAQPK